MVVPGSRADEGGSESPRRRFVPERVGGFVYLAVLVACAVGVWIVVGGDWRTGIRWFSLALVAGGVARLVLPEAESGMLGVRGRYLDAALLVGVGAVMLVLAGDIPEQSGA
ncbi:DUF3017 domain-containing protein [Nocardioides zeae]|uniref:DUF3017 domain-containing protein n=1 Tax=Nocardioides imazamoxiresistens TaxID=3231893 RepID=A0ABU3PU67_9ACTN|nr:DUF3017 domain-containing protein [Nocardioides zeae]MDT9592772.1 DUF3017 domain-containing protein [Nocardioides zeae]